MLNRILSDYASLFATNTPTVNLPTAAIATELKSRSAWDTAWKSGQVTGYRVGNTVTISAPTGTKVTATMPAGTQQAQFLGSTTFGSSYAGKVSGWTSPGTFQNHVSLTLPSGSFPALQKLNVPAGPIKIKASFCHLPVPNGVVHAVPAGAGHRVRK